MGEDLKTFYNFEDFFADIFNLDWTESNMHFKTVQNSFPFCDIYYDKESNLIFEFALAGYKKEQISISLERGILTIKSDGYKKDGEFNYKLSGIKLSGFKKSFSLPEGYYEQEPKASFENGILKIIFKLEENHKPKQIGII